MKIKLRPRFSLQSLLFAVLLAGAAGALWIKWDPWRVEKIFDCADLYALFLSEPISSDGRKLMLPYAIPSKAEGEDPSPGPTHIYDFDNLSERIIPDSDVKFAPDNKSLVSIGDDHQARIWDPETCELRFTLSRLPEPIETV